MSQVIGRQTDPSTGEETETQEGKDELERLQRQ